MDSVALDALAEWSPWRPLLEAVPDAPRLPGVYMARLGAKGEVLYVGMAGLRAGRDGTRTPRGLWGRLRVYTTGRAAVSGLGEYVLDLALADADWLSERVEEVRRGEVYRATEWAKMALRRANIHVRWATTSGEPEARALEERVQRLMPTISNRRLPPSVTDF